MSLPSPYLQYSCLINSILSWCFNKSVYQMNMFLKRKNVRWFSATTHRALMVGHEVSHYLTGTKIFHFTC
jgi:hypothetical protein